MLSKQAQWAGSGERKLSISMGISTGLDNQLEWKLPGRMTSKEKEGEAGQEAGRTKAWEMKVKGVFWEDEVKSA